jgi:DNA-binding winged helix-turn-helix (wHTH) protein
MEVVGSGIFEFERFRLDRRGGGLFCSDKHGAFVPVAIGSRALDVLCVLVQRHGDLVFEGGDHGCRLARDRGRGQ